MKSIIANFCIISMISTIISSEKSLQKKERGGGLYGNSTQLSVINNARSSLVKKHENDPFISTGALTSALILLTVSDLTPSFPLDKGLDSSLLQN
jgi:hypothetical protein